MGNRRGLFGRGVLKKQCTEPGLAKVLVGGPQRHRRWRRSSLGRPVQIVVVLRGQVVGQVVERIRWQRARTGNDPLRQWQTCRLQDDPARLDLSHDLGPGVDPCRPDRLIELRQRGVGGGELRVHVGGAGGARSRRTRLPVLALPSC